MPDELKKPEEEKPALPEGRLAPAGSRPERGHQDGVSKSEGKEEKKKDEKPTPVDKLVESKHSITIDGQELKYTVVTGTMVLKEETADREKEAEGEKPKAQVFFTAYTRDDVEDKSKRPITFSLCPRWPRSSAICRNLFMDRSGVPDPRGEAGVGRLRSTYY